MTIHLQRYDTANPWLWIQSLKLTPRQARCIHSRANSPRKESMNKGTHRKAIRAVAQIAASIVICGAFTLLIHSGGSLLAQESGTRIEINASRFVFSPAEITIKEGSPVKLVMLSTDVSHGLRIRELGVELHARRGQHAEVTFTPHTVGDFIGRCSVFCGSGHSRMTLVVHVVQ